MNIFGLLKGTPRWLLSAALLTGLALSAVTGLLFGATALSLALLLLLWPLTVLVVIDIRHQLLPDCITLPLLWAGLLVHAVGVGSFGLGDFGLGGGGLGGDGIVGYEGFGFGGGVRLRDGVFGAAAGYLLLWSVYHLFKLLTGKEGMGYGDFKLLAALGAWLGWQGLLPVVLISSLSGVLVAGAMALTGIRGWRSPLPFGAFLAPAGYLTALLLNWG